MGEFYLMKRTVHRHGCAGKNGFEMVTPAINKSRLDLFAIFSHDFYADCLLWKKKKKL